MPLAKTISQSNTGFPDYLDFRFLLEEGRTHLGKFSGDLWTDHNTHDPGITILEALIFALLDLGYRTHAPIQDLLAPDPAGADNRFFTAKEILGCNPLTVNDYRKLLIDIPGVRNAWLEKLEDGEALLRLHCEGETSRLSSETSPRPETGHLILNGLYRVWIQPDPVRPQDAAKSACNDDDSLGRILREAHSRLHSHRNLCEDFAGVNILQEEQIGICAGIEIEPDKNADTVLAEMFLNLDKFISPVLPFYSLQDLLKKGKTTEEVFEGRPLLAESHGFIDTEELESHELREVLNASDLYRVMLDTPGVRAVRNLVLFNYIDGQPQTLGVNWQLCLTKGYFPVLSPELSQIAVFKDGIPTGANFRSIAERFRARLTDAEKSLRRPYELDLMPPVGDFRSDLGDYYSIQNEFPLVYGIGEGGLAKDAPKSRRAQAMQLKGYLLFFDQLLANYLNQLTQVRDILSVKGRPYKNGAAGHGLSSVPLLDQLIRGSAPQPEGDNLTGSGRLYQYGDAVVYPFKEDTERDCYQNYFFTASPEERDRAVRQVITALETGEYDVTTAEGECGYFFQINFRFSMPGETGLFALRSVEEFTDKITEEAQRKAIAEAHSLTFLGLQIENFRLVNRPYDGEYSFELVYQSRRYEDYLAEINAPGDTARQRREALLNHLLARFGEDFSEYALLSFNVDASSDSANELLDDKERFLTEYADISRDRGKGFDYTRADALWDTDNVSGLEQRVAGLMGIDDWKRRTLSPFATAQDVAKTKYWVEGYLKSPCRNLWEWETFLPYADDAAKNAAFEKLKNAAAQPERYKRFDCEGYGIYGFGLEDENGCLIALHPDTYGSKILRDNKIGHFIGLFGPPEKTHCWHVEYPESPEGWMFYLRNEGGKIVLQSAAPADTEEAARITWIFTRNHACDLSFYEITEDPLGRRFSFAIKNEEGGHIAVHPDFYPEKHLAEQARDAVFQLFEKQKMDAPLLQRPDVWTWELTDGDGNILLQNLFPFASEEQAANALCEALTLAADAANYERTFDETTGEYGFFLVKYAADGDGEPTLRIAAHPMQYADPANPAEAEAARDNAIAQTALVAQTEAAFSGKILPKANAQRFQLCDADGSLLLTGAEIFPDLTSLDKGWAAFLDFAASEGNYQLEKEDGFRVWLEKPCHLLAEVPAIFATEDEALAHIARSVYVAGVQRPAPKIETLSKAWTFRLTDAAGKAILTGCTWYETQKEAQSAYLSALFQARKPENLQAKGEQIYLCDADGCVFAVSEKYPDKTQIGQLLEAWREWFASECIRPRVLVCPGEWYFEIKKDGVVVLESVRDYAEQAAAALDLEAAIRAGCEGDYRPLTAEDACRFSFEIADKTDGRTLAAHPVWYETPEDRDEIITELTKWFCSLKFDVEFLFEEKHYHWELMWETCDERIEPVLVGQISFDTAADAEADFVLQMNGAIGRLEKTDGNGQFSLQLESAAGEIVALHPRTYATEAERDKVLDDLKSYLDAGTTDGWCQIMPNSKILSEFCWRYRLDKAETVAEFCPQFVSPTERNEFLKKWLGDVACQPASNLPASFTDDICLLQLLDAFACHEHEYSSIDFTPNVAKKIGSRYIFQLKTGDQVWWESAEKYSSPSEAFAAFEAQYLEILRLAADSDNYEAICKDGEACRFVLKNSLGQVVARSPHFDPDAVREAYEIRLRHALTYPVFADDERFGFQLYDFANRQTLFLSTQRFDTPAAALDAFHHFLELLRHSVNLQALDLEDECRFSFTVQEAGLEGTKCFQTETATADPLIESAWEGLDEMLTYFGTSVHFYSCFDALAGCRFRLFLAKDKYQVARSCRYFHTAGEREEARDLLFRQICCGEIMLPQKPALCRGFFNGAAADFPWQPGLGMLVSDLFENPCYEEIQQECKADECFFSAEKLIDLMAFARSLDCYVKVSEPGTGCEPDGEQKIRLGLLDDQNQIIAFGRAVFDNEQAWTEARDNSIRAAWLFPLVRRGDGFGFQLATPATIEGDEVYVEILFESAVVHPSPEAANTAYEVFFAVIKNKNNWQRTETDDCGPFGIEIVDPAQILAEHPATYPRRDQLAAVQAELETCLESEGFHVLEHILLRPREEFDMMLGPCVPPSRCDTDFTQEENYLPGLDPYSFWATVVIPYWSPRFRNLNLRNFFERTLRQEAPAHVALRIAWVDARHMKDFETAYRLWLETQPQGEASCGRQTALNSLLDHLKEMVNKYPPSRLYSENLTESQSASSSITRLDFTIL
jgi:hypothetical protein